MARRKKSRSAWGSLTQIDANTWRLRYWSSGPDGYKRRSKTIRNASRLDAERVRSELMLAHSEDAPCPTVGEVWASYALPDFQRRADGGDVTKSTLDRYRSVWTAHVAPQWERTECSAVRPLAVQQWLYGLQLNAARQGLQLLRHILDYAVRYECIDHNPARERYLMPSRQTTNEHDKGTWTLDELGAIWRDVAWGQWWEAAFLLCAFGGMRVGESLGVQSADVALRDVRGVPVALVTVQRQVHHRGGVTDALKTRDSRRVVAIPGRAAKRLATIATERDGWLTGDGMGNHCPQKRLMRAWADAPMDEPMRHPFRNLRNSWQTNMRWTMRMPPWLIEPMLGHKMHDVTGQHYDRPQAEMFADAVADAYSERPYDEGWTWAEGPQWD